VQIKTIALQNFRNHRSTVLALGPGVNVLVGDNAQGKTNLLEAIYLTCVGKGFRTPRDREMVKFGETVARVKTMATKRFGDVSVEVTISTVPGRTGKQIKINDIPIAKMGELMGSVSCVFFSPDELKLIKEAPADRRRFMDIDISQMDKVYFYSLLRYNKILQQRNALLKTISQGTAEMRGLDIWDEQLATAGAQVIRRRLVFCEQLRKEVTAVHKRIAPDEVIDVIYDGIKCGAGGDGVAVPVRDALVAALLAAREKDLRLRTTTVGPHRDDLAITINGKDVRSFASQGQQRTAALSLKLSELVIFETITGERPVLLLDDVLSELDADRQRRLLEMVRDCQCVITATNFPPRDGFKIFKIKEGSVKK